YNELDKLDPTHQGESATASRLDIRYIVSVLGSSVVAPGYASMTQDQYRQADVLYIGKYSGEAIPNRPLMSSLWLFRYTDMLLSLAEKRAFEGQYTGTVAIGDYSNVESIIFNIRANRTLNFDLTPLSMPTDFSSAQAAYARILEERRVEFAFEGYRYLDMKRLGERAGSPGFVRDPQDCVTTGACQLEPTSTRLTLPIPRSEMISNPNMVQNPGY
ncbi:MAG TPA: RagB/SusD family nutrient uptake outer membrane protein, partial [Flavobacterium sp.]|nr:RagB/SusD family nutrient uptake outer membrane protein [Flavobacterium sp.]